MLQPSHDQFSLMQDKAINIHRSTGCSCVPKKSQSSMLAHTAAQGKTEKTMQQLSCQGCCQQLLAPRTPQASALEPYSGPCIMPYVLNPIPYILNPASCPMQFLVGNGGSGRLKRTALPRQFSGVFIQNPNCPRAIRIHPHCLSTCAAIITIIIQNTAPHLLHPNTYSCLHAYHASLHPVLIHPHCAMCINNRQCCRFWRIKLCTTQNCVELSASHDMLPHPEGHIQIIQG
jgi:hypothetical protein